MNNYITFKLQSQWYKYNLRFEITAKLRCPPHLRRRVPLKAVSLIELRILLSVNIRFRYTKIKYSAVNKFHTAAATLSIAPAA